MGKASLPSAQEMALLRAHCNGDSVRLAELLAARLAGVPLAYLLEWLEYRGRRFFVDRRVFITDPETGYMLDEVISFLRSSSEGDHRCVAEIGTGCGAIGICLKLELPSVELVGLEIDPLAIEVAKRNCSEHGVNFEILQSDFFSAWGQRAEPSVIFGDLPWGDDDSVYSSDRPIEHYRAMPLHSAFPQGGPLGMHRKALESVRQLGWSSRIFLNCGMLPVDRVLGLARDVGARECEIVRAAPNVSILNCRMN